MEEQITAPYNPRFPNQNQTKHCWANYVDFHGCVKHYKGDDSKCQTFFQSMTSLCPTGWIQEWDEQLENKTFPSERV
ncbi:hypothetical protein CYY_009979 [Polysphondylium violaceum]|uniref:Cytochrome c oxidase subunit n=1 Tax=Polysphondylium violaceum TaxID=133409 RepID=A0A8J4UVI8_9MYCE|nr:hypothetical protein CYY_009979 [Polysphondylium violaceum]